ncbi:MAG: outer membrane protein assembly factor BamD [Deltaproteobacteria bacterium]
MKKTTVILVFGAALCLAGAGCASFSETAERYRAAISAFDEGQTYFAIVHLRHVIEQDPTSPYAPQSMFALGEYYYDNADYFNSIKTLSLYIKRYPDDKGAVFAKLLIYKMITAFKSESALSEQEEALMKEIRKELFSQPLFFIFYDKKSPRSYKSLFHHAYLVYDYVDRIKVFRDDKLFLELSP